jgi:Outer membrane protein beta-barrel domain
LKFLILLILALVISLDDYSQPSWNFFAGPQITGVHYTIGGTKQDMSFKPGFQAGIGCKVPFENQLSFSPVVFYSLKGYKVKFNRFFFPPDSTALDNNTTIHTIEVGAMLQFDFSMRPDHFFIKGGPSLDFQIFGNEKYKKISGEKIDQKMGYGFGEYGRYAASLLAQLGYETKKGLFIFVQYTHGFTNLSNADSGPQIQHRAYGLSAGKFFGHKK